MHESEIIYVFDLDGVITDPKNSEVNTTAVDHLHGLLKKGELVAINTGRSYAWVQDNLLQYLAADKASPVLDHLFIACEKGGESLQWRTDDFQLQTSRFALPPETYNLSKKIFQQISHNLTTMFWDDTKRTMATIEKRPQADLETFKAEQQLLTAKLQQSVAHKQVKVDSTTIATDIESPLAGKQAGAELIYEWATIQHGVSRAQFICFGDSRSDYSMATYFAAQGANTTFVFVGDKHETFPDTQNITITYPNAKYALGTIEYLNSYR
jgi:hydroxymethylpyrimidine pyrophosphatase-like HAD family hydrolase